MPPRHDAAACATVGDVPSPPGVTMKIHVSSHGAPRNTRRVIEDAWRVQQRDERVIAALADGMGSARLGGEAARRAVEMITDYYLGRPQSWSPRRALTEFAARINRQFYLESQVQYGAPELMCTLSVAALEGGMLYILNVGDSPIFVRRGGAPLQVSEDHVVAEPGMSHVLTQAIGASADLEPHTFEMPLAADDVIVLCSDGISRAITPRVFGELLERHATARTLVAAAQEAAREQPDVADDASAIVLEVLEPGRSAAHADRPVEVAGALHPGDRVDDLVLVRPLQSGDRVWETLRADGSRVVAKFPPIEAAENETRRDAFVREAWQASRIDSPDIVRAWIPAAGTFRYYAMEFIDAPTLRDVIRTAPLASEDAIALALFLLRAAQHLLKHDIVHGDIKPDNVLVRRTAAPGPPGFTLLDLGSAGEVFSDTTRAGTPSYLAPERFRGTPAAERTELFSIGVTLYEGLTGALPYGEIERFQTPRFESAPKPPSRTRPAVPDWLEAIVLRAVSADPARRYQAFSEMLFDLEHPDQVRPFYRDHAPLLERDPVLFYKALCLVLTLLNAFLIWRLSLR